MSAAAVLDAAYAIHMEDALERDRLASVLSSEPSAVHRDAVRRGYALGAAPGEESPPPDGGEEEDDTVIVVGDFSLAQLAEKFEIGTR